MKQECKNILLRGLAISAIAMAKFSANITCSGSHHQEKLPAAVKKFRKF